MEQREERRKVEGEIEKKGERWGGRGDRVEERRKMGGGGAEKKGEIREGG